jgi:hypothetical protein
MTKGSQWPLDHFIDEMMVTHFTDHHGPVRWNGIEHPVSKTELAPGFDAQVTQVDWTGMVGVPG